MRHRLSTHASRILCIIFSMTAFASCDISTPKVTVINETYAPSRDSLYAACADITGFGPFAIDKMTYKQYLNSKDIKVGSYSRTPSFYSGHWSQGTFKDSDTRFDLSRHLIRKGFKQVDFATTGCEFVVGDVKMDKIEAVFWDDILVGIYVDVTYDHYGNHTSKLLEHYIEKYGNGEGKKYCYESTNWTEQRAKANTVSAKTDKTEDHLWSNGKISIQYHEREFYEIIEGKINTRSMLNSKYYLITGERYQEFMTALDTEVKAYFAAKEQQNSDALSNF